MHSGTVPHQSSTLSSQHRFAVLDAWRGVCALLVTLYHIPLAHRLQGTQGFLNMQMFVDFFFVLSGFVMCHAYGQQLNSGKARFDGFMIRRFGRVYPLHLALILGFLVLELAKMAITLTLKMDIDGAPFTGPRSLESLGANLLLIQSFNLLGMTSWNGPAWSISVEFYAYFVFAVVVMLAGMRTALFTALATIGVAGVALLSPNYIFTTHNYGFLRCIYGFFVGCLVYQAVMWTMARGLTKRFSSIGMELAVVAILILFIVFSTGPTSLLAPIVFAGVVYVFAFERGIVSTALHSSPAQALGLWSYSIYMVHVLIFTVEKLGMGLLAKKGVLGLTAVQTATGKLWTFNNVALDAAFFATQIALTLVVSKWTYDLIEDPWRRRFAAIASRRELKQQGGSPSPIPAVA